MPGGDIKLTSLVEGNAGGWRPPRTIYAQAADGGVPKVTANKLIVLSTHEWVLPIWSELHATGNCDFQEGATGAASVLVSTNDGASWENRGHITSEATWLIENTVVELKNGQLKMFFRTLKNYIYEATSKDKGYSWSEPLPTKLLNPDSKPHAMRLSDGSLAMAYNNHAKLKRAKKCRTNLDVAVSTDEGRSWTQIVRLEAVEEPGLRAHYPTLLQVDCTLYVAYSKFYHEEYMQAGTQTDIGLHIAALDMRV